MLLEYRVPKLNASVMKRGHVQLINLALEAEDTNLQPEGA